jgi:hypothetical protein
VGKSKKTSIALGGKNINKKKSKFRERKDIGFRFKVLYLKRFDGIFR